MGEDEYFERWHSIWEGGLQRGERFDLGHSSPSLQHLLGSKQLDVVGQRVLVPGCGRGYDVATFAVAGATRSVGLEISEIAVREANAYLDEALGGGAGGSSPRVAAAVHPGNFFTWSPSDDGGPFDVGYDYTFGCAMHPTHRMDWAAAWARLLRPGGTLVTLLFPVDPAADPQHGPPYPVSEQLYRGLLQPAGFKLESMDKVQPEHSAAARAGREWLGVWRRC